VEPIKTPVVIRDNYVMYLELYQGFLWFHTDVSKWTPQIKKEYLINLNTLQKLSNTKFLALIEITNNKLAKFAGSIGFKFEQPFLGGDGQMYHIYVRGL
jgi:hypothetical protein